MTAGFTAEDDEGPEVVRLALDRLRPADREILTLAAWNDLPNDQITAVLSSTPPAVAVRLHRARCRLARDLGRLGYTATSAAKPAAPARTLSNVKGTDPGPHEEIALWPEGSTEIRFRLSATPTRSTPGKGPPTRPGPTPGPPSRRLRAWNRRRRRRLPDDTEAVFEVHRCFKGDPGAEITLDTQELTRGDSVALIGLSLEVGQRHLISGTDGFAWACGYSLTYDTVMADHWADLFGA